MKRILTILVMANLAAYGQKIETQKADQTKITRLATTLNHLSVLEFNEPVKEVAVGSSNFKVEWRENKVFVQPIEPDAATNLFIWTASGRQSYELVPAESVAEMHFAIDEDPVVSQTKLEDPPQRPPIPEEPKIPAAMLMESTPVKVVGSRKNQRRVEIVVEDIYQKDTRIYLRYAIANRGTAVYLPAAPAVYTLKSPRAQQSLIVLANSQLAGDIQLRWKYYAPVPLVHAEAQAAIVRPGQTTHGIVAFDIAQSSPSGERPVVMLRFPDDGFNKVSAVVVL